MTRIRKDSQGGITFFDRQGRRQDLEWKLAIQNYRATIGRLQSEILALQERIEKRKAAKE